jgi:amidohydrolase
VIVSRQLDINKQPAVLTFGTFNGGQRFNIVPDSVELSGTIRTFDEGMRKQMMESLRTVAEHVAAANGASVTAQIPSSDSTNPVNTNDPALTARVRASLEKALGKASVVEPDRWTASEDFPYFGLGAPAPSVYFFVGATPVGQDTTSAPTNHSPKFFLDEGALAVGSEAMLQAALDFLGYAAS